MTLTRDVTAPLVTLRADAGDEITLQWTSSTDLTGYTFASVFIPAIAANSQTLVVDVTQQESDIVSVTIPHAINGVLKLTMAVPGHGPRTMAYVKIEARS